MKKTNNKLILYLSLLFIIILTVVGTTIAFFGWTTDKVATVNVTVISGKGDCSLISDNNVMLEPTYTRDGGRIITLNARQELATNASIKWNIVVNEINGLADASFKYELVNTTTGASYTGGNGNFQNTVNGTTISLTNSGEVLSYNENNTFTLYLWIDGTMGNNSLNMANQIFNFDINCEIDGTIDTNG